MKAISTIIEIIIIIIIVVAIISLLWLFSTILFSSVTQTGTTTITHVTQSMSSCMRIESVSNNNIYLRNCGQDLITNDTLNIYMDDLPISFNMTPSSINPSELAVIAIPVWRISIGIHNLRITNPNTELTKTVKSSLPDSCVLALDFDESSGTIAHDSSGYGNDGMLTNNPKWSTDCKFGNCLNLNASGNQYVLVHGSASLNFTDALTMEAWIKRNSTEAFHMVFGTAWGPYVLRAEPASEGNNLMMRLAFSDGSNSGEQQAGIIDAGKWYHITGTYDGNKIRLYINGVNIFTSQSFGKQIAPLTTSLRIGCDAEGFDNFNGTIDSLRIFSKPLAPDETVVLKMV